MKTWSASSSSPSARDAAEDALAALGSALDAVVAGFFALSGELSTALFAPTTLLLAGPGVGARAYDGRSLEPGRGVPRPRGYRREEEIPLAARAAVPRGVAAVLLAHANWGRRPLRELTAYGSTLARRAGQRDRAEFLARIGATGSGAIFLERARLTRAAGPNAGGTLSEADLELATPLDEDATIATIDLPETSEEMRLAFEPFTRRVQPIADNRKRAAKNPLDLPPTTIVASDRWGRTASCAVFHRASLHRGRALDVEGLDVALPLTATPVRRGTPRVAVGSVHLVAPTLVNLDCGPELRAAIAVPDGLPAAQVVGEVLSARPISHALAALGRGGPVVFALTSGTSGEVNVEDSGAALLRSARPPRPEPSEGAAS
ncbi:MAG: hypothetical protein U0271_32995 [Polyangiaceae bacterium]